MDSTTKRSALAEAHTTPGPSPGARSSFSDVLTEAEAIQYLRLDLVQIEDPAATLFYYRKKGLLRGTQIGKCIRYRRIELERFLERLTEQNPR